jgi:hypothetical protein
MLVNFLSTSVEIPRPSLPWDLDVLRGLKTHWEERYGGKHGILGAG